MILAKDKNPTENLTPVIESAPINLPPTLKASSQSDIIKKSKFNLSEEIKEISNPPRVTGSVKDHLDDDDLHEKPKPAPEIQVIPNPPDVPAKWDDYDPDNRKFSLEDLGGS